MSPSFDFLWFTNSSIPQILDGSGMMIIGFYDIFFDLV